MRLSTIIKGLLALMVICVVTVGAVLYKTDFSQYKSEISTVVQALTDRRLVIKGKFKLTFGLRPALAVDRVSFSNAKWGSRRDMVRIKRLRAELRLIPLMFGRFRIKQLVLSGADILLETRANGVGNWNLQPSARNSNNSVTVPTNLTFDKVLIKNSVLVWRDRRTGDKKTIRISRLRARAAAANAPLKLDLRGSYNGERVKLDGNINSLDRLTSNKPTSFELRIKTGGARISAKGQLRRPITGSGIKVSLKAAGKNFANLSGLVGTALPAVGPYDFAATAVDKKSRWRLKNVKLKLGKSDLNGDVYIDPNTTPVRIVAKLKSDFVRAVDFEEKKSRSKRSRSKKKKRRKRKKSQERVFSNDRLSFSGLEHVSLKLFLKAKKLRIDDFAFEQASFTASIRKNQLVLRPARARYEGGNLTLYVRLTSEKRGLRIKIRADARKLNVARLVKRLGYSGLATGRLNVNTSLSSSGSSMRTLMARLNGHLLATMNGGRIDNKKFAKLSGETLSSILPWSEGDKGIHVQCFVAQYNIRKGKLNSNVTLLNTDRLLVEAEGGVDLGSEKMDVKIIPRAKEASLVNLLVPIKIDGILASPDVYADPGGVVRNVLGFATGGILANGIVSEIIGSIVSGLSGADKVNPCVAAKTEAISATPSSSKKKKKKVKKDNDDVLDSIGDGLKSLFGR